MQDWIENEVGALTDEQYQRAIAFLKTDLQVNNNIPPEQVDCALELFDVWQLIQHAAPACVALARRTTQSEP
jgi:hypothetical protein